MTRDITRREFLKVSAAGTVGSVTFTATASASTTPVVAFDIDGSLTRAPVRDEYRTRREDGDMVGIVTARSTVMANDFIQKYDLNPAFIRTATVKWPALRDVEREYPSAPTYTYVGSWARDWVAALIAGWGYVDGGAIQ